MEGYETERIILRKEGETALFKLKSYESIVGVPTYVIWDTKSNRYLPVGKFTKGRSEKFDRIVLKVVESEKDHVIIIGEATLNMSKTTNSQFMQTIETLKAAGKDPLEVIFRITRHGAGLKTTYEIKIESNWEIDEVAEKVQ